VDARPLLVSLARTLQERGLEAVLIGNAAAALQGAPVTTVDFDFVFRKSPAKLRKLKSIAKSLGAVLLKPHYPASGLFRIMRDEDSLQIDFMATVDGVRSFAGLRSRASRLDMNGHELLVADLADIVASKRAANRPRDRAVLEIWKRRWMKRARLRKKRLDALARESERNLREQIRRLLAKPPSERTHFLRVRVGHGSCL